MKLRTRVARNTLLMNSYQFWMIHTQGKQHFVYMSRAYNFFYISQLIKTRLIMLWFATCEKVDPDELELLLAHARLDKKYKESIDNLSYVGVQLSKSASKQGEKSSRWHRKKRESIASAQEDVPFDLSRYVPVVKRVAEASCCYATEQQKN